MSDQLFAKRYYDVLRRPLLTEKGQDQRDNENKYLFEVEDAANKLEIAQAVERLFGVRVVKVNTQQVRGKRKRVGRNIGKRANWKKAIVTLHADDTIDLFEGV
jgi:large subunit ribosomal protein L23